MEVNISQIYSNIIHQSRYARYLPELNRRETWSETINRYNDFWVKRLDGYNLFEEEFRPALNELQQAIYQMEVMPSMRSLMTAGPALERDNVCAYNCSFVSIDKINKFSEILYVLMCGTGVGFSVEDKYICKLPELPEKLYKTDTCIVVADTKIGWAKAYRELLVILYSGLIPNWDLSRLRPAGAPLKTFGGRSSGPEPLDKLFNMTVAMFKNAVGRRLYPIECHDLICHIGNCVVVGGVRRSALISLSDLGDKDMRDAKSGSWWVNESQRSLANNSAVFEIRPTLPVFLDEWQALYKSQSGERGIFNRDMAIRKCKEIERPVNYLSNGEKIEFGTNPCGEIILRPQQFCVAGNTHLITKEGIQEIKDYENEKVNVWNGEEWSNVVVRKTRTNQKLIRVTLSDGSYLDCTTDHKFSVKNRFQKTWNSVQAKDLMNFSNYALQFEPYVINDENILGEDLYQPYTLGFAVGDGHIFDEKVFIDLYGEKDKNCPIDGIRHKEYLPKGYNLSKTRVRTNLHHSFVSKLKTDSRAILDLAEYKRKDVLDFISGWADADGSQASNGIRIYLSHESRARALQLLLSRFGIKSSVNLFQKKGTKTNLSVRKNDLWYIQITKTDELNTHRLISENNLYPKYKGKYQNIKSVEEIEGLHDVYCFVENKRNMAVFNNVLTYQCNLSELVARPDDEFDELSDKVIKSTILGTLQSSLTDFKYLSKEWKKNCDEERLLGVSITGICDNPLLYDMSTIAKRNNLADMLQELKEIANQTNREWACRLGIESSRAITTIKPSGCCSLDTKIKTTGGIKSLLDIFIEQEIHVSDLMDDTWYDLKFPIYVYDENNKIQEVTKLYCNGIKDVYEIEFEDGNTYHLTGNHKLKTKNGEWKRVDELTEFDEIMSY